MYKGGGGGVHPPHYYAPASPSIALIPAPAPSAAALARVTHLNTAPTGII